MNLHTTKWNYYNEIDPFCCEWLTNLIDAGHLPQGEVDSRPIEYVQYSDIKDFRQCHFFAGIGGWPYALSLANIPYTAHIWTGSCPCQPFSIAGQRKGNDDSRHLWPFFHSLIYEALDSNYPPPIILGEQVASADGRHWLTGVRSDMEELGYAFGATDLCAAGAGKKVTLDHGSSKENIVIGAPHIRQRLYWGAYRMAHTQRSSRGQSTQHRTNHQQKIQQGQESASRPGERSKINGWHPSTILPCLDSKYRRTQPGLHPLAPRLPGDVGQLRAYGNAISPPLAAEFIKSFLGAVKDLRSHNPNA